MLPTVLVGAVLGVMWGVFSQRQGPEDDNQQEGSTEQVQQQHEQAPLPLQDNSAQHQPRKSSRFSNYRLATALGGLVCLAAAATVSMIVAHRRRHGRKKQHRHTDGRIPLKDLIRFKERQWFVEELENARDADPNAMLRLAKMYLNGQGCQQNIALAQEWVRKARSMGVPATLDELYATDDPDPRTKLRTLAAMEERRRSLRQLNSAAARSGHKHMPQQHTAAA